MTKLMLSRALLFSVFVAFGLSSLALIEPLQAADKTEIRLYKINKFGQSQRLRFTNKESKLAGCHNLKLLGSRVHRAVHYGFAHCTLYAKQDCASGSEVGARQGDNKPWRTVLTQGYSWYLGVEEKDDRFAKYSKEERGKKVRSWSCTVK